MRIASATHRAYTQLTRDKWPALYTMRLVGVLLIFIYHAWGLAGDPVIVLRLGFTTADLTGIFRASALGTTFVFVLAGFFNYLPYERAQLRGQPLPPTALFMKRRLLRIVPLYYCSLVVGIIMSGGISWINQPGALVGTLASFGFVQSFLAHPYTPLGGNWAVQAVAQFYVLVPLIARLMVHHRWYIAVGFILIAVVAYRAYIGQPGFDTFFLEHQLWPRLDQFLIGMLAAKIVARSERRGGMSNVAKLCGVGACALLTAIFIVMMQESSWQVGTNFTWLLARMIFALAISSGIIYLVCTPHAVVQRVATHKLLVQWVPLATAYSCGTILSSMRSINNNGTWLSSRLIG